MKTQKTNKKNSNKPSTQKSHTSFEDLALEVSVDIRPYVEEYFPAFRDAAIKGCDALMKLYRKNYDKIHQVTPVSAKNQDERLYKAAVNIVAFIKTMETVHNLAIYNKDSGISAEVAFLADILKDRAIDFSRREFALNARAALAAMTYHLIADFVEVK